MSNSSKMHLRGQDKCCSNCRYFRISPPSPASAAECILLGRTLSITSKNESYRNISWGRERLCDGWKKRPQKWIVYANANPHWEDQYYKRETLINLKKRLKLEV